MRFLSLIISGILTIALVIILDTTLIFPLPVGKILNPQQGAWQNAEDKNTDFSAALSFPQLEGRVSVYFDERLVPHVFAEKEKDLYFVQGYLHASFRLWQMDLQAHYAAGRASEIFGEKALNHDREFRRLGMVYAAQASLNEITKDPATKAACDAYTNGVNAYIETLTESQLPLEYKLMGYYPEKWSNLKTALFMKYIAFDLAGHDDDFEMSNANAFFSKSDMEKLFPPAQDSLNPVIPIGTTYITPSVLTKVPADADSAYFNNKEIYTLSADKPDRENGSNNWAVNGTRTISGAPILCNDPHLGLGLPSVWYEMQLSTPDFNVYGVSFPGAPNVIIGFNDSCAFGFTNGGRDVRDYYDIKFRDKSRKEYWFDSTWKKTSFRIEQIHIKGKEDYYDTVAYTVFGPVMYDNNFKCSKNGKNIAVRWKAHDPSNELKAFYLLNRSKNYSDYSSAISWLHTPGQNSVFACKNGDIAIKAQGEWPAKWRGQGDFIMPGADSSYMWQAMIPDGETPYLLNPERGFVSSANQRPVDTVYPYYLGRNYPVYRGIYINRRLSEMQGIGIKDMMALQTSTYDVFAEYALPKLLSNIREESLNSLEKKYLGILRSWKYNDDISEAGATIFDVLWKQFAKVVYDDEYENAPLIIMHPSASTLLEGILRDSAYSFLDNIKTSRIENLTDDATQAFKDATKELVKIENAGNLPWARYKGTSIMHLSQVVPFSAVGLPVGGGSTCINAATYNHGPSWRMIVSLTHQTMAFGIYPGGQSGNPGSRYYDDFIPRWAESRYYQLWMMRKEEENDHRVKWKMFFANL